MSLFMAINSKYVLYGTLNIGDAYDIDKRAFKTIDLLKKFVLDKYRTLNGWYYVEVDIKTNKTSYEVGSFATIDLNVNRPYPLFANDRIWKYIPGFKRYMASNLGEILTLKTANYTKGVSAGHYLKVSILKDGEAVSKMQYVHILICTAFHGLPKPGEVVMHLDDNKFNCKENNLKWGSQSQNIQDVWNKRRENHKMKNTNIVKDLEERLDKHESLENYVGMLSLESGFIKTINAYVLKGMDKVEELLNFNVEKISDILSINKSIDISEIKKLALKVNNELKDIKYVDVEDRQSPVIIGLNTNLLVYNETMLKYVGTIDTMVTDSLSNTSNLLSNIMSDESFRKSFKPKDFGIDKIREFNSIIRHDLGKLVDVNAKHDRLAVNRLVPNIASISTLTNNTATLANKLKLNNLDEVKEKIAEISDKVGMLTDYIEDKNNEFTIAKTNMDTLARALDVNGELVTLYSTLYMLINQQIGMVTNLIEIIKE